MARARPPDYLVAGRACSAAACVRSISSAFRDWRCARVSASLLRPSNARVRPIAGQIDVHPQNWIASAAGRPRLRRRDQSLIAEVVGLRHRITSSELVYCAARPLRASRRRFRKDSRALRSRHARWQRDATPRVSSARAGRAPGRGRRLLAGDAHIARAASLSGLSSEAMGGFPVLHVAVAQPTPSRREFCIQRRLGRVQSLVHFQFYGSSLRRTAAGRLSRGGCGHQARRAAGAAAREKAMVKYSHHCFSCSGSTLADCRPLRAFVPQPTEPVGPASTIVLARLPTCLECSSHFLARAAEVRIAVVSDVTRRRPSGPLTSRARTRHSTNGSAARRRDAAVRFPRRRRARPYERLVS